MHLLVIVIGEAVEEQIEPFCGGQYDWYQFGGRFRDHLILKAAPGRTLEEHDSRATCYEAHKGGIDFAAMSRVRYGELLADWNLLEKEGTTTDCVAKERLMIPSTINCRKQFVAYAKERSRHNAPDVLVWNEEWIGPWWLTTELTEKRIRQWDNWFGSLIASLPEDTLLTVVDCHVV